MDAIRDLLEAEVAANRLEREAEVEDDRGNPGRAAVLREQAAETRARARSTHSSTTTTKSA